LEIGLLICPPTSFSDDRTGAFEKKICSIPPKFFFNSIGQTLPEARQLYTLPRVWLKRGVSQPTPHNLSLLQHEMLADVRLGHELPRRLDGSAAAMPLITNTTAEERRGRNGPQTGVERLA
jgi:hypothetical protein